MRPALKAVLLGGVATIGGVLLVMGGPSAGVEGTAVATADAAPETFTEATAVSYDRDIRPILSDRCFTCHGPDSAALQADLRLDVAESATATRDGVTALVPGDLEGSELWRRVNSHDPDVVMPPPVSEKSLLSPQEKELVRRWIEQGAVYENHWSFEVPVRPELPAVKDAEWARNPIDHFILARLDREGLAPSPEADRATLLRRVFLDLTGLPPTLEELDAFLADERPDAYERWVDRLLTEEPYVTRYAERMASPWLDQSRYADTIGIHTDNGRSIWPWRDWVLEAYRDNMPFDQFVTEQLAGDLIPDATTAQKVATGFLRNHVITDEGGAIVEEYLTEYAVDRVATTGSVFLGLTLGCARCHDHKFDPITHEDFFGVYAFFNSNDEPGLYSQLPDPNRAYEPSMAVPSPQQYAESIRLSQVLATAQERRDAVTPTEDHQREQFLATTLEQAGVAWETPMVKSAASTDGATLSVQEDGSVLVSGENPAADEHRIVLETDATNLRLLMLEALADPSLPGGRVGRAPNGNAVLGGVTLEAVSIRDPAQRRQVHFDWVWADIEQEGEDLAATNILPEGTGPGWAVDAHNREGDRVAVLLSREPFGFEGGTELHVALDYKTRFTQHSFGRVRLRVSPLSDESLDLLPGAKSYWYLAGPFPAPQDDLFDHIFGPEEGLDLARTFTDAKRAWTYDASIKEGEIKSLPGGPNAVYVGRQIYVPTQRDVQVSLGSDDGIRVYVNGAEAYSNRIDRGALPDQDRVTLSLRAGRNDVVFKVVNTGGPGAFYGAAPVDLSRLNGALMAALLPDEVVSEALSSGLETAWRTAFSPEYREAAEQVASLEAELAALKSKIPLTMVMSELPEPRPTFVLERGQYDLGNPERPVDRSIPTILGSLPESFPKNRLGLAQWIVSDENPLTARVTANRLWEQVFGYGLVRTSEDFGMQGEWPSHPALLDWLAVEFRASGWDVRELMRQYVTSSTYRQSSRVRPDAEEVDPENRLLAFYPRQRLAAEQIRDSALHVSGLLVEKLGGPSVKPYQPEGLWKEVSMLQSNTRTYEQGEGEDLGRRSLYTYWKRAVPPPSMLAFDAPTREFCVTSRMTTNTPLQALVLWNDEQFVEAARMLATRTISASDDDRQRLVSLVRRCTGREPTPEQLDVMVQVLDEFRARYKAAPKDADALVNIGYAPVPAEIAPDELAAWMMIANAVLSADAAISKN